MSEPVDHLGRMMVIWNMIEAWLQIAAPESLAHLYTGATEQQLQATETALGFSLPGDLNASWSLHNPRLRAMRLPPCMNRPHQGCCSHRWSGGNDGKVLLSWR